LSRISSFANVIGVYVGLASEQSIPKQRHVVTSETCCHTRLFVKSDLLSHQRLVFTTDLLSDQRLIPTSETTNIASIVTVMSEALV
jgi:hypothetical protein